jgi:RNase adaptor protein for sRNA GlmZ degradation
MLYVGPQTLVLSRRVGFQEIQRRMLDKHELFKGLCREVKEALLDESVECICFWCKSGRHRSVACAELISFCIDHQAGFKIWQAHHVCRSTQTALADAAGAQ